jgi:hypothetical protein
MVLRMLKKKNGSLGFFFSALWFQADYIGWFFCSKIGELEKSWCSKTFPACSKKNWAVFKILNSAHEDYKGWKKFIAVLNFWLFWKNPDALKFFGILRICVLHDNLVPYKDWRKFSLMPKHFGHIGKILMLKKFQAVQEFACCLITLGRL